MSSTLTCLKSITSSPILIYARKSWMSTKNPTIFSNVAMPPPDPIFNITERYNADKSPKKVNLGVGAYRDAAGKPYVLPIVKKVEIEIANDLSLNKEYLPVTGDAKFVENSARMLFGLHDKNTKLPQNIRGVQTLSGAGACRVLWEYFNKYQNIDKIYFSDPTWNIHKMIAQYAGYKSLLSYAYYDNDKKAVNFEKFIESIKNINLDERAVLVLHGPGHNPTGCDLTVEQTKILCEVLKNKPNLVPFIDCAYLGFASGNVEKDCAVVRQFLEHDLLFFVGLSYAKIMGMYNERIGSLTWNVPSSVEGGNNLSSVIFNQVRTIIRANYSNPPSHGARIVSRVLETEQNRQQWFDELSIMSGRIASMREQLHSKLVDLKVKGDWSHIVNQKGLFSFTGLKKEHVEQLEREHHIYMTASGRINICGIIEDNVGYIAESIKSVVG